MMPGIAMAALRRGVLGLSPFLLAACAGVGPDRAQSASPAAAGPEMIAAEQDYRNCLLAAARYADDGRSSIALIAPLIAPMCYPRFAALDWRATEHLSSHARRQYEKDSDQRQIDFANEAIGQERAAGARTATR
jgi:hypothetical protein